MNQRDVDEQLERERRENGGRAGGGEEIGTVENAAGLAMMQELALRIKDNYSNYHFQSNFNQLQVLLLFYREKTSNAKKKCATR